MDDKKEESGYRNYITVLLLIAAIMKKQAPDSSDNIAMSVAACVAAGAFGGFFSP